VGIKKPLPVREGLKERTLDPPITRIGRSELVNDAGREAQIVLLTVEGGGTAV
jgi:hypothetical protein